MGDPHADMPDQGQPTEIATQRRRTTRWRRAIARPTRLIDVEDRIGEYRGVLIGKSEKELLQRHRRQCFFIVP